MAIHAGHDDESGVRRVIYTVHDYAGSGADHVLIHEKTPEQIAADWVYGGHPGPALALAEQIRTGGAHWEKMGVSARMEGDAR